MWNGALLVLLRRAESQRGFDAPPRKVLWIRVDRVGDLLISTPLFRALAGRHPDCRQDLLCSALNEPVARAQPELSKVWVYAKRSGLSAPILLLKVRREGYDWVVNLNDSWSRTAGLMARLSAGRATWGAALPGYAEMARTFYSNLLELPGRMHQGSYMALWAERLGLGLLDAVPRFRIDGSHREGARRWFVDRGLGTKGARPRAIVGILMGNQKKGGRDVYPLPLAVEVSRRLSERHRVVALWGTSEELAEAEKLSSAVDGVVVSPELDIPRLAAFLAELDAVISPCTGPLHLAQAVRTPIVALCRRFTYDVWRPVESPHVSLVGEPGEQVKEIPPQRVLEGVETVLSRAAAGAGERTGSRTSSIG